MAHGPAVDDPAGGDHAAPRRCEGFADASSVALAPTGAWKRADLTRALVVSGATDDAVIRDASRCNTVIDLRSGMVAVHARDLGGGELRVHTDVGDVVVHGTAFSVRRDASGLAVEVVEGTVGVELAARPGTQAREIAVPMDHRFTTQSAEVVGLAPAARAGLRVLLGLDAAVGSASTAALDPRVTEPEPSAIRVTSDRATTTRVPAPSSSNAIDPARAPESTIGPSASLGVDALVRMAEAARRAGDLATARRLYREAGARGGATAEAAWLSLARLELRAGSPAQATRAIDEHRRRFGTGRLGAEAAWIGVRAARASGDEARARRAAEELVRRFPASPQATAARQLLH